MTKKTKICVTCEKPKSLSSFNKKQDSADGLNYSCKKCASEYAKDWRLDRQADKIFKKYPLTPYRSGKPIKNLDLSTAQRDKFLSQLEAKCHKKT